MGNWQRWDAALHSRKTWSLRQGALTVGYLMILALRSLGQHASAIIVAITILTGAAMATPTETSEYQFELVEREVRQGYGAVVTVRLIHQATGKVVPDAIVFMSRIDMSPDGMDDMDALLEPVPDTLPGYYRFETDLVMKGDWALFLMAKLPGKTGYVRTKLTLTAVP